MLLQSIRTKLYHRIVPHFPARFQMAFIYRKELGYWPDLHNPRKFNEKLLWRKLYDRDPRLVTTADKVAVRDYVAERIGPQYLAEMYGAFSRAEDIDFDRLPNAFVMKANHGSTWNELVPDKAAVDPEKLRELAAGWLEKRYVHLGGEWWYNEIKPQIIVEEFLGDAAAGIPPNDYKFFVFRGKVGIVVVDMTRFSGHRQNLYYPDWTRIDCQLRFPAGEDTPKPRMLDEMLEIASKLGADFNFVRVDLYEAGDRVVFGELTHCPGGGRTRFTNPYYDEWLGSLMRLD